MSDQERTREHEQKPAQEFQRRERAQPAPPLDRESAGAELNRFLDLVVREMRLEVERDIS